MTGAGTDGGESEPLVLLVEDDASLREVTELVLQSASLRVVSEGDGRAALERFQREPGVSLVVLDLMACRTLEDDLTRVVLGPAEDDEACADLDGGSEVDTIVGTVDGREVDTVIRRDDGCGVERWDALGPLLPDPDDLGAEG